MVKINPTIENGRFTSGHFLFYSKEMGDLAWRSQREPSGVRSRGYLAGVNEPHPFDTFRHGGKDWVGKLGGLSVLPVADGRSCVAVYIRKRFEITFRMAGADATQPKGIAGACRAPALDQLARHAKGV
jgi:hypothetical protein